MRQQLLMLQDKGSETFVHVISTRLTVSFELAEFQEAKEAYYAKLVVCSLTLTVLNRTTPLTTPRDAGTWIAPGKETLCTRTCSPRPLAASLSSR